MSICCFVPVSRSRTRVTIKTAIPTQRTEPWWKWMLGISTGQGRRVAARGLNCPRSQRICWHVRTMCHPIRGGWVPCIKSMRKSYLLWGGKPRKSPRIAYLNSLRQGAHLRLDSHPFFLDVLYLNNIEFASLSKAPFELHYQNLLICHKTMYLLHHHGLPLIVHTPHFYSCKSIKELSASNQSLSIIASCAPSGVTFSIN